MRSEKTKNPVKRAWFLAVLAVPLLVAVAWADLETADRLREEGKHAEAVEAYKKVLAEDDSNPKALYGIGFCLTEIGKAEAFSDSLWAARQKLEKLVALAPEVPEYRYLNGYSAYLLAPRDPSFRTVLQDLAEKEFTAALEARPEYWESWFHLGRVLRDKGVTGRAAEAFNKAIALRPDRLEPYPDLALLQLSLKRYDECIAIARDLLAKNPRYVYAHKIIGDAFAARPDFAKAEAEYLVGAVAEPLNNIWADSLWLLFQRSLDGERAIEVFGRLVEKNPEAESFRKFLALTYANLNRHEEAAVHFRALTEKFPKVPWYAQGLAEAEDALGNEEAAVAAYLKSLRLNPNWSNPFIPLRDRFNKLKSEGKYEEAGALFRRVEACNPCARTHSWVLWEISECTRQVGDVEGTILALKKAMDLDPIEPRFHNSLGLFYRALGKMDLAVAEFHKALDLVPGYMYTTENMAATFQMAHKDDEAYKWLVKGVTDAQEQHAWAGDDMELKSEREFDIFKFSYFLHEMEILRAAKKK